MHKLKEQFAAKVSWYLKRIGQDTGHWDKVKRKEVDPFVKMYENDPNKHIAHFVQVNGQTINVRK